MEFDILNNILQETVSSLFSHELQLGMHNQNFILERSIRFEKKLYEDPVQKSLVFNKQQNNGQKIPNPTSNISPFSANNNNNFKNQAVNEPSLFYSDNNSKSLTTLFSPNFVNEDKSLQLPSNITTKNTRPSSATLPSENSKKPVQETTNLSPEQWIFQQGPAKLKQALGRLKIDLNKISKSDLQAMSYDQLSNQKKRVKNELQLYDSSFQNLFNRFPLRNEKEPLRPLYIYYQKLKQYLSAHEQMGNTQSTTSTNTSQMDSKSSETSELHTTQDNFFFDTDYVDKNKNNQAVINSNNHLTQESDIKQQIEELRAERADLREKLHVYQTDFTQNNNRKIRFHQDIAPVQREYQRYQDIQSEIALLEAQLQQK